MNVKIFLISRLVIDAYISRDDFSRLGDLFEKRLNNETINTIFRSNPDGIMVRDVYDSLIIDIREISAIKANGSNR